MLVRRRCLPGVSAVIGVSALLGLACAPPALAYGPGENVLVSGLPGLAPPTPAEFAWNESPVASDAAAAADVSADGRWAVFGSSADGLVTSAEDRRYQHVFVKDRQTGTLINLTTGANGSSFGPTISDDGTRVAFETKATNLVPNDPTPDGDVVVRNLVTGATSLITNPGNDGCSYVCASPQISGDGSRVAFVSTAKLVAADGNSHEDVYSRPSTGGGAVLVSRLGAAGAAGNAESRSPTISDDGKIVAFQSAASNLVATDSNLYDDVFVRDTVGGQTVLASASSGMSVPGNGHANDGVLSGDGNYVVFVAQASNLGDGDSDGTSDVHRRHVARATTAVGSTVLVSKTPANVKTNAYSLAPQISDDGSKVSFFTGATNLPAGIGSALLRNVTAGTSVGVGAGPDASVLALSGSGAIRLVTNGTFVPALEPGLAVVGAGTAPEILSRPSSGTPLVPQLTEARSNYYGDAHVVSRDGRYVAFVSGSPALTGAAFSSSFEAVAQVFRRDNRTGEVILVSRGSDGLPSATGGRDPSISSDGSRVAFLDYGKLTPDAAVGYTKAYVRDLAQQTTTLATRPSGTGASALSANVEGAQISGNGRHVVFVTDATTLDPAGLSHSYVRDLSANTTVLVDRANGAAGAKANGESDAASISADGTRVAFRSWATNLDDGTTASHLHVHVRDLVAGTTVLASRAGGATGAPGNANSWEPAISADGTAVAFGTDAKNLDSGAGPWPQSAQTQMAVRNLVTATTTLVSRGTGAGAVGNADAKHPSISDDGRIVAYDSVATNLGNPASRANAVFVRDVASGEQRIVAAAERSDPGGYVDSGGAWSPGLSGDGRCVAFAGWGVGLVPDVSPDYQQIFVRVLDGDCGTPARGSDGGDGGAGGGGGGLPNHPGTPSEGKPRLSGVRLTRTRFRVGVGRTATSRAKRAKRTAAGTTVRFTLSAPATVRLAISRPTAGRKVGASCRKPTRALRKRRTCVRQLSEGTITRKGLAAGSHTVKFTGRVGRNALRSGKHQLRAVATGKAGTSNAVTRKFTVVRR